MLEHAHKLGALHLKISGVEEMDVAFMQILLSLQHYQLQRNQPFSLQLDLNPALNNLLQLAGIEKNFSTNLQ
ncbi:hypothetical protein D770_09475 [Flammeovirgaceae bacterium 311]|nr:hypothetical protein D770_09475 [Flammeovirgaceae bacterium 311]